MFFVNVTTLLMPLFAVHALAKRIVPQATAYVDLRYVDVLKMSAIYHGGVIAWVAFWALYGQGFGEKAFRGSRVTEEMSDIDMVSAQMRFAFPSVSVSQTQQEFDEALKQEGIRTAEDRNGNTILGLTKDGKMPVKAKE